MIALMKKIDLEKECKIAWKRIHKFIRITPVEQSFFLSEQIKGRVFLKLENFQITGSFKLRGALNKILSLSDEEKKRGVITASSGNHGAAVAYISKKLGINATLFLPSYVPNAKIEALSPFDPEIRIFGNDCLESEIAAKREAKIRKASYISPYNDRNIITGQGTIGMELIEQIPEMDTVIIPVGGGGLMSGIAGYLKNKIPEIEIIGVQPENSPVMAESIKAGKIVKMESKPTLSDGTAGGIEKDSITFDLCKEYADRFVLVPEHEIAKALKLVIEKEHYLIEGAAALTVAALTKESDAFKNKNICLIISGSKIGTEQLKGIL
jgi:threonine dehydratase